MKIKIYGEARSATTYLERLVGRDRLHPSGHPMWKHGFPKPVDGALHILLMRDLYEWCRSMATGFDARYTTFTGLFGNREGHRQSYWSYWENMIECRTQKYKVYLEFAVSYECILLKTEYLKEHPEILVELGVCDHIPDITNHVRLGTPGKDDPGRPELTKEQLAWVDEHKDPELESFVDNLTYFTNELTPQT